MLKVGIIGGGAAGMMTAVLCSNGQTEVHVFEKNEKLGKKLFITGKGRCNVTNSCATDEFFTNVVSNAKFLYSSIYDFDSSQVMEWMEKIGVPLKVERGNRVFPVSDHSSDIIRAMEKEMRRRGVKIHLNRKVKRILAESGTIHGIQMENGTIASFDVIVVATGGMSYPSTGSDGDGYRFARECGHSVTQLRPALVPLVVEEDYIKELQGLSLKNAEMKIADGKKILYEGFGELLFTHFGISGPLGLSASSVIGKKLSEHPLTGWINLKPALTEKQLDARILREFEEGKNKQFRNVIHSLFPSKLIPVMQRISGIDPEKQVNAISKGERLAFEEKIRKFPFTVTGTREFSEAIITQGGVAVKEISPATMESKKVRNLYFVGEILDVDALTGGFNLQIAWSTAHTAAKNILNVNIRSEEEPYEL
ncbi:MAG: NAD(P)/FAD-dependent oxidoreductase [Fusicatenibacter sp.]|nr:NAD(P)/FAD-dependent oxidoreductase [Fusicatenibacter sp.]